MSDNDSIWSDPVHSGVSDTDPVISEPGSGSLDLTFRWREIAEDGVLWKHQLHRLLLRPPANLPPGLPSWRSEGEREKKIECKRVCLRERDNRYIIDPQEDGECLLTPRERVGSLLKNILDQNKKINAVSTSM